MSKELPYMAGPGTLPKILNKIIEARVPESFNADFLGTVLGFPGGNQRTFISWAKKCGLINADGTPTQLYKNFRNPDFRGSAMTTALKTGYEELYTRNEYTHVLSDKDLKKLISDVTGKPHDNSTVKAIFGTFNNAKEFADFEISEQKTKEKKKAEPKEKIPQSVQDNITREPSQIPNIGLTYTINLVLPKTDDPAIYDAIFRSLKDNLLNE